MSSYSDVTTARRIDGIPCKRSLSDSIVIRRSMFFLRAKCGNGFDDATLDKLQSAFQPKINKISKNFNQIPKWRSINRELVPDFIVIDPKQSPVWEITVGLPAVLSFGIHSCCTCVGRGVLSLEAAHGQWHIDSVSTYHESS